MSPGSHKGLVFPAPQFLGDSFDYRLPARRFGLPKKPQAWVPWTVFAIQQPSPIRRERQQDPTRLADGSSEMDNGGVHGNNKIQSGNGPRCVDPRLELWREINYFVSAIEQINAAMTDL